MALSTSQPCEFPGHVPPEKYEKVLIVGEPVTGKTKLWDCIKTGTMEADVRKSPYLDIELDNGKKVCLGIVDTSCQPDYSAIRSMEYDDAKAVLLSFDLTEDKSLTSLEETWYPEVRKFNSSVPVFLVGFKWAVGSDVTELSVRAEAVAGKISAVKYFTCTSENVESVVPDLLKAVAETVTSPGGAQ